MLDLLLRHTNAVISPDLSVDQKILNLTGENEELTQSEFRKYGIYSKLESVTISGIHTLGDSCMMGCMNLNSIIFLGHVLKVVSYQCFRGCSSLQSISFQERLVEIQGYTFYGCKKLAEVFFPTSLRTFSDRNFVFSQCSSLKKFHVEPGNPIFSTSEDGSILIANKTIGYYGNHESIRLPAQIEELASYFLNNMNNGLTFTFEEESNLTIINKNAFRGARFSSLIFPSKLKVIKSSIFELMTTIDTLFLPSSLETVSGDIFIDQPLKNLTIEDGCKACHFTDGFVVSGDNSTLMFIPNDLEKININKDTNSIATKLLQSASSLSNVTVDPNNQNYFAFNNLLYDKNYNLIACPHNLKNAVLDSRCTNIQGYAFYGCNVESLDFNGAKIKNLGAFSLRGCKNLVSKISLPSTIEKIYSYCIFSGTKITGSNLVFGENLTLIDEFAIHRAEIYSVDLSKCKKLEYISNNAFEGCKMLISLKFPDNLKRISESAFKDCSSLSTLIIPDSISQISPSGFEGCSKLSNVTFSDNSNLSELSSCVFKNCNITSFVVPTSVKKIATEALAGNQNMREIVIKEDSLLEELYSSIFQSCNFVTSIKLGKNVKSISSGALSYMNSLQNIEVDGSNPYFCSIKGVLHDHNGSTLVACPSGRKSLVVETSVVSIGRAAFLGCSMLESIELRYATKLSSIANESFYGCINLRSIRIPSSIVDIESGAFTGCISLSDVIFDAESKLQVIKTGSFLGCDNLTAVVFEGKSSLQTISKEAFSDCTKLSTFTFPPSLQTIGVSAFKNCPLSKIDFGLNNRQWATEDNTISLQRIEDEAFAKCSKIEYVALPPSVEYVGNKAFTGCDSLKMIVYCGSNDLSSTDAFDSPSPGKSHVIGLTSTGYQFNKLCGIRPLKILDNNCRLSSHKFTIPLSEVRGVFGSSILPNLIDEESK